MEVVAYKDKSEATEPHGTEASGGSNFTDNFPLPVNFTVCRYCLQAPCITLDDTLPLSIGAFGPPDPRNLTKRYKVYRTLYRSLKLRGLWRNPVYLQHKMELGCRLMDVWEVMPHCVINYALSIWPNP